jgi:organic hydroperoxide reductase OsmC/OhrA
VPRRRRDADEKRHLEPLPVAVDVAEAPAHTIELAGQTLAASSAAEFGGNSDKADPEEMFVASLSSCHMLWFFALARSER